MVITKHLQKKPHIFGHKDDFEIIALFPSTEGMFIYALYQNEFTEHEQKHYIIFLSFFVIFQSNNSQISQYLKNKHI